MNQGNDFEQERRRLTAWAWWVTGGYGLLLLLLASMAIFGEKGFDQFRFMQPNEVGDLLAGVAGPLAFIWLVYGYFLQGIAIRQQAEELSQNTRALKLQEEALRAQVEELKSSVDQQRELVEVSRMQLASDHEEVRQRREKERRSALPRFSFHDASATSGPYSVGILYTSSIENTGAAVSDIKISCSEDIFSISPKELNYFDSKSYRQIQWNSSCKNSEIESWILIEYVDALGNHGRQKFHLEVSEKGLFNGRIFEAI